MEPAPGLEKEGCVSVLAGVCGCAVGDRLQRAVDKMSAVAAFRDTERFTVCDRSPRAYVSASTSSKTADCASDSGSDVGVVVCGEILDRGGGSGLGSAQESDDAALVRSLYRDDPSCGFFAGLDGEFVAVIQDRGRQLLHLVSDRVGVGRVYILRDGHRRWFCSAPSGFAEADGPTSLALDASAAGEFLDVGYFLEDRTWLKGCSLLSPATIWSFDLSHGREVTRRYWTWEGIPRADDNQTVQDVAPLVASLLKAAVARRCRPHERTTVTLSGGLDSRAILAAAMECSTQLTAVTFGRLDAPDVRLAARIAQRAGVKHSIVEIGAHNWLQPRVEGVWRTGGEMPLLHMHGIEARAALATAGDANLNGFAGDLIIGGSYLLPSVRGSQITVEHASQVTGASPAALRPSVIKLGSSYRSDYYYLENRVRRFTALGPALLEGCVADRKPFVDRRLLEFVYSLPDAMRLDNRLYRRILLTAFPDLYRHIPWQKTGVPISWPSAAQRAAYFAGRVQRRARRAVNRPTSKGFADYAQWLRDEPAKQVVETMLMRPEPLFADLCDPQPCRLAWSQLLSGVDTSETISRYLTMELWLQQIMNGRFRAWDDLAFECGKNRSST
jgi:asparagine synthase (glutamine-hydrolysing)